MAISDTCPTVSVMRDGIGPIIVNLSDYEDDQAAAKSRMKLVDAPPPQPAPEPEPSKKVDSEYAVTRQGRWFYIVEVSTGDRVADIEGLDGAFKSDIEAWGAISAHKR